MRSVLILFTILFLPSKPAILRDYVSVCELNHVVEESGWTEDYVIWWEPTEIKDGEGKTRTEMSVVAFCGLDVCGRPKYQDGYVVVRWEVMGRIREVRSRYYITTTTSVSRAEMNATAFPANLRRGLREIR